MATSDIQGLSIDENQWISGTGNPNWSPTTQRQTELGAMGYQKSATQYGRSNPSPGASTSTTTQTQPSQPIDYTFKVGQESTEQYNARIAQARAAQGTGSTAAPTAPGVSTGPSAVTSNQGVASSPTTPQNGTQQAPAGQQATQQQGAAPLTFNGSVVDLLNQAGQDSSFAARQALAQQFGIQGYQGTAAQNTELGKKYTDAYNAKKGSASPQSAADANTALAGYFDSAQTPVDPQKAFMDSFAAMNPVEAQLYTQLSSLLSAQSTQQSFTELYQQEVANQGIPGLQMELADLNRIMDGTEDDIRDEITHSGGFATESQVQALSGARNKVLLRKAQYLSDVLNMKNDYVDRIVSLTQADRQQVSEDLDRKIGLTKTLFDMTEKMQSNAKENYMNIVQTSGWGGLAATLKGNTQQTQRVENLLGLAPGELQQLAAYQKPLTEMEKVQLENAQLQNKKIRQDLATGPAAPNLQFVAGTANQPGGVFNPKTGVFTPMTGTKDTTMQLATAQSNIGNVDSLLKDPAMSTAVATNKVGSWDVASLFTGAKSNFIAGVQQVQNQLTLQNLQNAKANGATFGALSEGELALLNQSASKLGSWAQKDSAGNVTYYKANTEDFKAELDKINNFAKLDYVLKGGDPGSVGVVQQADGTLWVKNANGSYTRLK